jgi:ATP-dependent 26S proteasome regulatory subunit
MEIKYDETAEGVMMMALKKHSPGLNIAVSIYEYIIYIYAIFKLNGNLNNSQRLARQLGPKLKCTVHDIYVDISFIQKVPTIWYINTVISASSFLARMNEIEVGNCTGDYIKYFQKIYEMMGTDLIQDRKNVGENVITFDIKINPDANPDANISKQFDEFISHIGSNIIDTCKKEKKIKIYNVKINRVEKCVTETNPEYESYTEHINQMKELMKVENGEGECEIVPDDKQKQKYKKNKYTYSGHLSSMYQMRIPPKTLQKTMVEKNIVANLMNEKFKDLSTLYLRKNDMRKLKITLENFHKRKEWMEEFGIPNKLGVLLYGEPGTGKTSTIWAIASYLQKDIYYVNLKSIQTNEELHMIFDHVNKNCINGGIVVFEDIDAASTIVHQRVTDDDKLRESITDIFDSKDTELTLEYFLNLLQGTLTQDGTIFMATTNHFEKLDKAFVRDGRFDVKIEMKTCDYYQLQCIYQKFIGRQIPSSLLNRIKEDIYTPASFIFKIKDYTCDFDDEEILDIFLS